LPVTDYTKKKIFVLVWDLVVSWFFRMNLIRIILRQTRQVSGKSHPNYYQEYLKNYKMMERQNEFEYVKIRIKSTSIKCNDALQRS